MSPPAPDLERIAEMLAAGAELNAEQRLTAIAGIDALRELTLRSSRAEYDALIIECRRKFLADRRDRDAAREIEIGLNRYRASAWQRDRSDAACPARLRNTIKGAYWAILRAREREISAERIRKILARSTE